MHFSTLKSNRTFAAHSNISQLISSQIYFGLNIFNLRRICFHSNSDLSSSRFYSNFSFYSNDNDNYNYNESNSKRNRSKSRTSRTMGQSAKTITRNNDSKLRAAAVQVDNIIHAIDGNGNLKVESNENAINEFDGNENIPVKLLQAFKKSFDFSTMSPVQRAVLDLNLVDREKDLFVRAKTGTGKTLAFLMHAIKILMLKNNGHFPKNPNSIPILIIAPTRELALQIGAEANRLVSTLGLKVHVAVGGFSRSASIAQLQNGCDILVGTPGRLNDLAHKEFQIKMALGNLSVLVFDEADLLLEMGFKHEIDSILQTLPPASKRTTVMFSATLSKGVKAVATSVLSPGYKHIDLVPTDSKATHLKIRQSYMIATHKQQFPMILSILKTQSTSREFPKTILFLPSTSQVWFYEKVLSKMGVKVLVIHSKLSQPERTRVSARFRNSRSAVLVTTDVSARGVDYPDVSLVLQVGLAQGREQYIHRIGRTGRAEKEGEAILVLSPFESRFMEQIQDLPVRQEMRWSPEGGDGQVHKDIAKIIDEMPFGERADYAISFLGYIRAHAHVAKILTSTQVKAAVDYASNFLRLPRFPRVSREYARKNGILGEPGIEIKSQIFETGSSGGSIKDKKLKSKLKKNEKLLKRAQGDILDYAKYTMKDQGFLEASDDMERVFKFSQKSITAAVNLETQSKVLSLKLPFGPYVLDYAKTGSNLVLGGRNGHISAMKWKDGKLDCEFHVKETVKDVKYLHNDTMFAVAQKKYTFLYDKTGMQIHRLDAHIEVNKLAFLPFHFLLASVGNAGYLKYQDTSTGALVSQHRSRLGACRVLAVNPYNAIINLGHQNGTVTLWAPSMSNALVKIACHQGPVNGVAIDRSGTLMATCGLDAKLKIWDVRTYKLLQEYYTPTPASNVVFSENGLLAVGYGPRIAIWKDVAKVKQKEPYMTHLIAGSGVQNMAFCPFEDILGVGHAKGMESLIVPGSGEANFDTFEANPYQTVKQRQENEVHALLEKIQPDMITLDPSFVGKVDRTPAEEIKEQAKVEWEANNPGVKFTPRNRAKGRSSAQKRFLRKQENVVDSKKIEIRERMEQAKKEREQAIKIRKEGLGGGLEGPKNALDRFKIIK